MELIAHAKESLGMALLGWGQRLTSDKGYGRARGTISHHRRFHKDADGKWISELDRQAAEAAGREHLLRLTGEFEMREVGETETFNLITNAGRIALHKQIYDTTGLLTNGFNWIALSNDTVTETATSTTLTNEIAANGLTRAQGTVTLPTGSGNVTTVAKVFTATGTQSAQKAALFTASSAGTMNHVLSFTQRNLINTDTLTVTYSLTVA